ncbi:MAG: SBBP repeat-containing protein [Myxococcota bacterium]
MRPTLALLLIVSGCVTPRAATVAWPAAPAVERVRLVKTLSGQVDLDGPFARLWRNVSGAEAPVRLYHPVGVAVTGEGDLVAVTDQALGQLFLFDFAASEVRTVAKETLGGAPVGVSLEGDTAWVVVPARRAALSFSRRGEARRLISLDDCERPVGLAVDAAHDRLYVSDASSPQGQGHAVHAHALSSGAHVATIGHRGDAAGQFFFPTFLALAPDTGLFVADTMNARVQELDATGRFVRQFGERGDQVGQFDKPKGIATDSFGNVYVVDSFFSVVQIFNREGKLLLFFGGRGDSPGFLSNPAGIAIDAHNRIYVTNALNFRVEVYELVNTTAADSGLSVVTAGR